MSGRPFCGSYWVSPGRLLAGEYPGALDPQEAELKLAQLVGAGVTVIVDLTEEDEGLEPYDQVLAEGIRWVRLPVRDLSVPTKEEMTRILDTIDEALEGGEVVYVHCWGGVGRTGTVVGCHLVRHGSEPEEALDRIRAWLADTSRAHRESPETGEQRAMIRSWRAGA